MSYRWISHPCFDAWLEYIDEGSVPPIPPVGWGISEDQTLDILVSLAKPLPVKEAQSWPVAPVEADGQQPAALTDFDRQKAAFNDIPPLILAEHQGQFVASRNGMIVDHDADLALLTRRFRERYGRVPVYITRVGRTARMPTPFLR